MIGIYRIINLINKKMYIGQSIDIEGRYADHSQYLNKNRHINERLQKDWNIYGIKNFKFEVIEQFKEGEYTRKKLFEREIYWIKYYDSCENGYNKSPGGDTLTETVKIRLARDNWKNKINENISKEIKIKLRQGKMIRELCAEYNVSYNVIYYLKIGKTWKWVKI